MISANATRHFGSFELKEMFLCFNDRVDIFVSSEDILMKSRFLRCWVNKKYIFRMLLIFREKISDFPASSLFSTSYFQRFSNSAIKTETWDISQRCEAATRHCSQHLPNQWFLLHCLLRLKRRWWSINLRIVYKAIFKRNRSEWIKLKQKRAIKVASGNKKQLRNDLMLLSWLLWDLRLRRGELMELDHLKC